MRILKKLIEGLANNERENHQDLQLETLETREMLSTLQMGGLKSGKIAKTAEVDQFTFRGKKGDDIQLVMSSRAIQSGFTAHATLLAPSGSKVKEFVSFNGEQRITLPEKGVYKLRVKDDNSQQTGFYTVGFEGTSPISPKPARLKNGGIVNGSINNPIEKDQWIFFGKKNADIELVLTSNAKQAGFSTAARLYAPSGALVDAFFVENGNREISLPENGKYMLQINDDNLSQTGRYEIGFEGTSPISHKPVRLRAGQITGGSISKTIEKDQFVFNASRGDSIELVLTKRERDSGFTTAGQLFAPSGAEVKAFTSQNGSIHISNLPETGRYMLQVRDDNLADRGFYTIGFESITPTSPNAKSIPFNKIIRGKHNQGIEKDQFFFTGRKNQTLTFTVNRLPSQDGYTPRIVLYSKSGVKELDIVSVNGPREVTLKESGQYLVMVFDDNLTHTGNYELSVQK